MSTVVRTPPPSPGATSGIVSVEDYTKGFFAKVRFFMTQFTAAAFGEPRPRTRRFTLAAAQVLRSGYSPDPTENIDKSGIVFNALLRKLERVADRADVAIPLRCLRDEITHLWVANGPGSPTATELTEVMFMLFDRVEWECRRNPMPRVTPTGPAPDVGDHAALDGGTGRRPSVSCVANVRRLAPPMHSVPRKQTLGLASRLQWPRSSGPACTNVLLGTRGSHTSS